MGIERNQPVRLTPPREGGFWARLERLLPWHHETPEPAGASLDRLLDQLKLSGPSAADGTLAQAALRRLQQPGAASGLGASDWLALAQGLAGASGADRQQLISGLKAAGVAVQGGQDGRYVSFQAGDLRVTSEPQTNRLRRAQGDEVRCYEGAQLVSKMTRQDNLVTVTTAQGTQRWDAGTGAGLDADGLPVVPRMAEPLPGEAPRGPWASPLPNRLVEPAYSDSTDPAAYSQAYDAAIRQAGDRVLEPSNMKAPAGDQYNCHSFATTGAQGDLFDPFARDAYPHWLNNPMYRLTTGPFAQLGPTQRVHPGDVVVYRKDGVVTHTGVVRQVDDQGNPAVIESKFGTLGRFLHAPGDIPASYGAPAEIFRPEAQA